MSWHESDSLLFGLSDVLGHGSTPLSSPYRSMDPWLACASWLLRTRRAEPLPCTPPTRSGPQAPPVILGLFSGGAACCLPRQRRCPACPPAALPALTNTTFRGCDRGRPGGREVGSRCGFDVFPGRRAASRICPSACCLTSTAVPSAKAVSPGTAGPEVPGGTSVTWRMRAPGEWPAIPRARVCRARGVLVEGPR